MGEDWLRRSGGGAVAVFAPSGLSFNFIGVAVTEDVWHSMFGPEKRRDLAAPVTVALTRLCGQGSVEPCQNYILLGDPATRLQLRSTIGWRLGFRVRKRPFEFLQLRGVFRSPI